jgi:hypothetical protein
VNVNVPGNVLRPGDGVTVALHRNRGQGGRSTPTVLANGAGA